jgi:predicted RNase H-like HicB family nuclease
MPHYIAIIEDAGPDTAVGVWFPDLPGCTSAGDDIDEPCAMRRRLWSFMSKLFTKTENRCRAPGL